MTPRQELKLLTDRLKGAGRGIILFHDPRAAAMLPAFLHYLRDNHYRVGPVVPAEPAAHLGDVPEGRNDLPNWSIKPPFMTGRG